ncbi:MAG TPA: AMP-binding protein [Actinomycetota bacterium]|nr:AMP-binding protein [Actinomycetota bacterium]
MLEGRTLWELVEKRAEETRDALLAVDERGESLTYGGLKDRAERTAAGFVAQGVAEGSVVSWQLPSWLESIVLVAALSRIGAVQNPILPIYREREVGFIARQAKSKILLVPSNFRGFDFEAMARGIAEGVKGLQVEICDRNLPEGDPATLGPAPDPAAELLVRWLFYTSGTTADPKGAQHTDATIAAAARGMAQRLGLTANDKHSLVFPFTHIGGVIWLFSALMSGTTQIVDEAFNPETTIPLLQKEGVTLAGSGTYFHLAYLQAQRANAGTPLFPNVRCCPGGGAPKPPQLHFDIKNELGGVGIVSGYGLTESPILCMASLDDPDEALANTEGSALPGVELRVVTLEGKVGGIDEEGEIRAKAPQMMKGYLDASLDADAFDDEGWFRTGDLGRIDAEGNVTITGRLKDIIIRKGENISAKEVEDLLFTHPKVADAAVIGVPDPSSGERAVAVVALKDAGDPLGFEEMGAFLREKGLRAQAIPEQLETVDALPRNPSGKVLKQDLRKQYGS